MQCVAIDPTEERIAAGDNTGRILIWNGFKEKVPTLHKASPATTAVPTTATAAANSAAQKKSPADSDSEYDSDGSENAQQDSASGQHQQPMAQPGSNKTKTAGGAGSAGASVASSGKSMQDNFSKLQRCRASVPVTTVHWHAHPVGTLCFSADGALLLSGGEEAVLVSNVSHAACDRTPLALIAFVNVLLSSTCLHQGQESVTLAIIPNWCLGITTRFMDADNCCDDCTPLYHCAIPVCTNVQHWMGVDQNYAAVQSERIHQCGMLGASCTDP